MDENKELVETMEDYAEELEASFKRLHEGDIVTGTVVAVTDDQVLVDLKYFAQGVIDRENLSNDPDFNMKDEIQPGDLLTATVIQTDDGDGNVVLSRKEANDRMTWEHFRQLLDERTPLEVTISEVVNGGAVAMVEGVRGFIPASRLDAAYVEDLDSWNGKKIPVLVIEADEEKKRLVLSGRELAREKQDAEKKSRIARCETGAIMEGTGETIKPYGAGKWLKRTGTCFPDEQKTRGESGCSRKGGTESDGENPVYRKWQTKPQHERGRAGRSAGRGSI